MEKRGSHLSHMGGAPGVGCSRSGFQRGVGYRFDEQTGRCMAALPINLLGNGFGNHRPFQQKGHIKQLEMAETEGFEPSIPR